MPPYPPLEIVPLSVLVPSIGLHKGIGTGKVAGQGACRVMDPMPVASALTTPSVGVGVQLKHTSFPPPAAAQPLHSRSIIFLKEMFMNHAQSASNLPQRCRRGIARLWPVGLLSVLLTACGGGGGGDGDGGGQASPASVTLAAAPVLPAGAAPVPNLLYACGNVSLGALRSGEIEVPAGQVCVLQGTSVDGNIKLNGGSVLDARDVTVNGNIQADGAASVVLADASSLTGSVQIKQGRSATIVGARINGDLQFESNRAALLAQANQVGGNIQVVGNLGGVTLNENRANGNLQCTENNPAPRGSGNTAASIENQCLNMQPASGSSPGAPANPPVAPLPPESSAGLPPAVFPDGSNVTCRDMRLGTQTYANVEVPVGARCELIGTRLTGSLEVRGGASVDVRDTLIEGNVQADGATAVQLGAGRVNGSVQVDRGGSATLAGTTVGGAVQLVANGGLLWVQDLSVTGDIQLFQNRGGATLSGNVANGNLQCRDNSPGPSGSGNRAAAKEDQCRNL